MSLLLFNISPLFADVQSGFYIVQKGDSLGKISEKFYGTSRVLDQIYEWNREQIKNKNFIREGQRITLASIEKLENEIGYYRVKKGDYLGKISIHLFGSSKLTKKLQKWNPKSTKNERFLAIGTVLIYKKSQVHRNFASVAPAVTSKLEKEFENELENEVVKEAVHDATQALVSGNAKDALNRLVEAKSDDPLNPAPRILEIAALLQMGKRQEAQVRAAELVEIDPGYCKYELIGKLIVNNECKQQAK